MTDDIFDAEASAKARDKAIDQVDKNAEQMWRARALGAVSYLAREQRFFTTDDVWRILTDTNSVWRLVPCETHERRAMGGVMRRAARAGLIVATDRTKRSVRVACHRRPIMVWQSLCVGEP